MAKTGYKLQEFVAHSGNVNCLKIGRKANRLFITGGDDYNVNLWMIGKATSLISLCGHTSTVESVTFDSAEVLVLSGASSGVIKLWDLEEAKMLRTLTGHRSNCTAVEFHPFGEFFASGSLDTNLNIWDIRKKGCIHTYKDHSQGISTIKFSPDGRWVVSGGFDNVVKVWDLTGGKLLHDFKYHEGHIRSLDFHPLEFLLATGSADRTVKFWDLETFELIGSSRHEVSGVRSITFHPDGRTLFAGLEDSLKVYSWEPVICHDAVDMGWTTLGDLCIHDGKLLGCSFYSNSVGVWVSDISLIKPYGGGLETEKKESTEHKLSLQGRQMEKIEYGVGTFGLCSVSPDNESKEIKNIYIDCNQSSSYSKVISPVKYVNGVATSQGRTRSLVERFERKEITPTKEDQDNATPTTTFENRENILKEDQTNASPITTTSTSEKGEIIPFSEDKKNMPTVPNTTSETDKPTNFLKAEFGRSSNSANDGEIIEGLMQIHDATVSNLRSRLTKLQVVRHFWESNDIKGAISALRKLADQSVQADVISVLVEKMEIFTLDLFSCLLPVLTGLVDSKIERHVKVSLDMLLKLVVVFGPTIRSTISAPPSVGVDLHGEQRRECSNQCFMQLQKIRMILPILIRSGGVLAKYAQELNLVLQQPLL
ncbi:hypothetical protein PHAVU_002G224100 [Phaseolus vulgaris]|uniref:Katanin p80 WD40 repeat-containing subunit B1 homolog n=1 Tax=Phaseolus vulgaris TaxID=3885 RepID=V7CM48_PHAVU|nr:hypothetical protein PHAVU_002G224100g [Phaseolus vulgaris]ESW31267.1 hypothetical protein PHAVU_002G224100g [Phaseolus vulgaris]